MTVTIQDFNRKKKSHAERLVRRFGFDNFGKSIQIYHNHLTGKFRVVGKEDDENTKSRFTRTFEFSCGQFEEALRTYNNFGREFFRCPEFADVNSNDFERDLICDKSTELFNFKNESGNGVSLNYHYTTHRCEIHISDTKEGVYHTQMYEFCPERELDAIKQYEDSCVEMLNSVYVDTDKHVETGEEDE